MDYSSFSVCMGQDNALARSHLVDAHDQSMEDQRENQCNVVTLYVT